MNTNAANWPRSAGDGGGGRDRVFENYTDDQLRHLYARAATWKLILTAANRGIFRRAARPGLTGERHARFWAPQDGPQTHAYQSEADVIGSAARRAISSDGGKSDLLLGLAGLRHQRSIIFRRVFVFARPDPERSREIFNQQDVSHARDSFNEQLHLWRLADGRLIEFGSAQHEADLKSIRASPMTFWRSMR